MTILNLTVIAAIGIVTHKALWVNHELPRPQKYMWIAVIWGILGLMAETAAGPLAAAMAVGILLALAYANYAPYEKPIAKGTK